MYQKNDQLVVHVQATEAPFAFYGKFIKEDDENILIEGTVGDKIGTELIIPKHRITYIEVLARVSEKRRAYDKAWE